MLTRIPTAVSLAAFLGLMVQTAAAIPPELSTGKKPQPKDSEVYTLVGAQLAKVFATFQAPTDISAADADTKNPAVCLDYDNFGYIVRDNKVATCIFWANWPATISGIGFGQTYDQIIEKLGKPKITMVATSGIIRLIWNVKDKDRDLELMLEFNKDKKLERAVVRPPQKEIDNKLDEKKQEIEKKREESKQKQESQK